MLKLFLFILISVFLLSCSSAKSGNETLQIEVDVADLYCWLNLMPGNPGRFHLLGDLIITNISSDTIKELNLEEVKVYSNNELVYSFKPFFNLKNNYEVNSIEIGNGKEYTFGVDSGLNADERLLANNIVKIEMRFYSEKKIFIYTINNIVVEQAY